MALFQNRRSAAELDALVEYLPEAVIDRLLERRKAKRREAAEQAQQQQVGAAAAEPGGGAANEGEDSELSFDELVALSQPADLALDAFACRGVVNAPPRAAAVLSSLMLAPGRFLTRFSVVAQSGEEMVLTVDLQLQESLQPKYRGLQVVKKWFLKGITGEAACPGDLPSKPEPCWGPEAVVMAQLEALQAGDASGVFRFASPSNQAATGPVERFAGMLETDPFRPLLRHLSAEVLRTVQMTADNTWLIVGVRSNIPTDEPGITQRVVYSWSVRLQEPGAGPLCSCWMTEAVQPVSQNLGRL
ncbi:DUF4864 domain-containing [Micractinium conductrix]|uniref:DUF4864 domain-containing n=1 Tax=Micractinium conductrix TaxID=554055 RepID=A0A2P6V2V3_9CHLO|nr:DUF4864 domain-containing [Micractinium conductrix]|eukprot:PSC68411.1 DUF4864 domain-containing [Micractinium conductrix]